MYQSSPPQPGLAGGAYGRAMGQPQTSGKAIGSLVCGIVGVIIPFIGGVVAIVLGQLGLSESKGAPDASRETASRSPVYSWATCAC